MNIFSAFKEMLGFKKSGTDKKGLYIPKKNKPKKKPVGLKVIKSPYQIKRRIRNNRRRDIAYASRKRNRQMAKVSQKHKPNPGVYHGQLSQVAFINDNNELKTYNRRGYARSL